MIGILDGTKDRAAMLEHFFTLTGKGTLNVNRNGNRITDPAQVKDALRQALEAALTKMAATAAFGSFLTLLTGCLLGRHRSVRSDAIFAFPRPAPPAATESDGQLDVLDELRDLVSLTRGNTDRTSDLAVIRVVGMQDRHLPPVPSVFFFRHDYLLFDFHTPISLP